MIYQPAFQGCLDSYVTTLRNTVLRQKEGIYPRTSKKLVMYNVQLNINLGIQCSSY